jgi:beta-glucosidase
MSKATDFATANLDELVEALSLDEAIALTGGEGFWHTSAVPRLGIPAIKVSVHPSPGNMISDNVFHDK